MQHRPARPSQGKSKSAPEHSYSDHPGWLCCCPLPREPRKSPMSLEEGGLMLPVPLSRARLALQLHRRGSLPDWVVGPRGPQPSLHLLGMLRAVQKSSLGRIRKDLDSNSDSASLRPWASQRHFSHLYSREVKMYGHLALGNFCLPSKDPPTPAARTVQGDWQCHLQCRIWASRGCLLHKSSLGRGNLGGHMALTPLGTEG